MPPEEEELSSSSPKRAAKEDMAEQDRLVETALGAGLDEEPNLRAARKHMYRTFVAARFGFLGAGVRVRIPDCVVAAIRSRFRAPGCGCSLDEIATCTTHGYTGFRDA